MFIPIVFGGPVHRLASQCRRSETVPVSEDAFAHGLVDGRVVDCLSVAQQLRFHDGYIQRERDNHDIALLETLIGYARTT